MKIHLGYLDFATVWCVGVTLDIQLEFDDWIPHAGGGDCENVALTGVRHRRGSRQRQRPQREINIFENKLRGVTA